MNNNQSEIMTEKIYSEDDFFDDDNLQQIVFGKSSVLGTRKSQQDSLFAHFQDGRGIGIVCDGMGGLQGGERASQTAVSILSGAYQSLGKIDDIPAFLQQAAVGADHEVAALCDDTGRPLDAGTTLVSVVIQDKVLYWLSIGDSKIYFIRGNEVQCVNRLHNYRMTLENMKNSGQITEEEFQQRASENQAEALISYVGMQNVALMDISPRGLTLQDGDTVVLCSDGLYRLLSDTQIRDIIKQNMFDMQKAAQALTDAATRKAQAARRAQDNTSVVVVRYQEIL